jgi:NAD(P)-dependent dehydrogenase (short-subunit alcohol dehydrogenase family)
MLIDLKGKTGLVTASTHGIGRAIAAGLAVCGAKVILNGRSEESTARAKEELLSQTPHAQVEAVAADVSNAAGCDVIVKAAPEVDILVNNAGIYGSKDFFETEDAVWDAYWETNVLSGVRLSRAYLPGMQKKGWGRVVFISSESARNIPADMIHYGVSKTALLSLSRGMAKRMAGSGVTVNAVLPGPTISDGFEAMMADKMARTGKSIEELAREFVAAQRPSSVLQRAASVEEVANMVVYVCSPQASATSGAALRVDGGVVDDIV